VYGDGKKFLGDEAGMEPIFSTVSASLQYRPRQVGQY